MSRTPSLSLLPRWTAGSSAAARLTGLIVVALLLPSAVTATEEAKEPTSPVQEVVSMLEASIPEASILRWIESQNLHLEEITSDELIALHGAGASEDLLAALFDRVQSEPPPAPPQAPAAPPALPAAPPEPLAAPQPSAAATPSIVGPTPDRIEISYRPDFDDGEDPWDLHVYLDGNFLASMDGKRRRQAPLVLERDLSAGPHSVLLVQERHDARKGEPYHEARAGVRATPFEIPEGVRAQIELKLEQANVGFRPEGAVYVKVTADGKEIVNLEKAGQPPAEWQLLCEDVEANVEEGDKPNAEQRRQLKRCISWTKLWPEGTSPKTREELHGEML